MVCRIMNLISSETTTSIHKLIFSLIHTRFLEHHTRHRDLSRFFCSEQKLKLSITREILLRCVLNVLQVFKKP